MSKIVFYPPGETMLDGEIVANKDLAARITAMPLEQAQQYVHELRCMQGDNWHLVVTDTGIVYYTAYCRVVGSSKDWTRMLDKGAPCKYESEAALREAIRTSFAWARLGEYEIKLLEVTEREIKL